MAETTPGKFVWHELMTTDPKAALAFYGHLFGWKPQPFGDQYTMVAGEQGPTGGVMELEERLRKAGVPPHWMGHVQVVDVDKTAALAKAEGGQTLFGPQDIPDVGRFAVLADPQGAAFSVFRPNRAMQQHDLSKKGEVCWNELVSTDHEKAFAFYAKLFGWTKTHDFDMGAEGKYLIFESNGTGVGGMFTRRLPPPMKPHWLYYFSVPNLEGAMETAKGKGAKLMYGPMDVPGGRVAILQDPQGAAFAMHFATE